MKTRKFVFGANVEWCEEDELSIPLEDLNTLTAIEVLNQDKLELVEEGCLIFDSGAVEEYGWDDAIKIARAVLEYYATGNQVLENDDWLQWGQLVENIDPVDLIARVLVGGQQVE